MVVAQTIVRKVQGGSDPADHRFVILHETAFAVGGFAFATGAHMTMPEVRAALIAQGISEPDAERLLSEAVASFKRT